jgi:hypothetical protein
MRVTRTTGQALAASTALVMGSGLAASAAILHLPRFGFTGAGQPARASATAPPSTVSIPPPPRACRHAEWNQQRQRWRCQET